MLEYTKALGDAVKETRLKLGLSQGELAARIGVDKRTILNIEKHKGNPRTEVLFPLVRALEIDPRLIFYPETAANKEELDQIHEILSKCTKEELAMITPILESVLQRTRSAASTTLE